MSRSVKAHRSVESVICYARKSTLDALGVPWWTRQEDTPTHTQFDTPQALRWWDEDTRGGWRDGVEVISRWRWTRWRDIRKEVTDKRGFKNEKKNDGRKKRKSTCMLFEPGHKKKNIRDISRFAFRKGLYGKGGGFLNFFFSFFSFGFLKRILFFYSFFFFLHDSLSHAIFCLIVYSIL